MKFPVWFDHPANWVVLTETGNEIELPADSDGGSSGLCQALCDLPEISRCSQLEKPSAGTPEADSKQPPRSTEPKAPALAHPLHVNASTRTFGDPSRRDSPFRNRGWDSQNLT